MVYKYNYSEILLKYVHLYTKYLTFPIKLYMTAYSALRIQRKSFAVEKKYIMKNILCRSY